MLRKLADAYCKDARDKGLATGEASLTAMDGGSGGRIATASAGHPREIRLPEPCTAS